MDLLNLFKEYADKQEILTKLKEDVSLRKYSSSELHIVAAIGDLAQPNVTALANYLSMTRGGISKNIKKLMAAGLITAYQCDGNTKKIYYRLTEAGRSVYERHAKAHTAWLERDRKFLSGFEDEQLLKVADFMEKYIRHIDARIEESEYSGENRQ